MEISTTLACSIHLLTSSIDSDDSLVRAPLDALISTVKVAVGSYAGLRLTLADHGHLVTLTTYDDGVQPADLRTSVELPLAALGVLAEPGSALVLYARVPGAFVDLAADLSYAVGTTLVVDAVSAPDVVTSALTGLTERSTINRAIGALLDRGHSVDQAHGELARRATVAGASPAAYAAGFLLDLRSGPPTP